MRLPLAWLLSRLLPYCLPWVCLQLVCLQLVCLQLGCGGAPVVTVPAAPAPYRYLQATGLPGEARVAFAVEPDAAFFASPWPSRMRQRDDAIDLRGYPGRDHFAVSTLFDESDDQLPGFSISPVIYFRFEAPVPPEALALALRRGAIALMDVDDDSPDRGQTHPLRHRYFAEATTYVPERVLALRPVVPLRPDNDYVAVVRRDLTEDLTLGTSALFEQAKGTEPGAEATEAARLALRPAFDALHEGAIPRERVAAVASFHTQAAMRPLDAIAKSFTQLPAERRPRLLEARWRPAWGTDDYALIEGYYCTPNYQRDIDAAPFVAEAGGRIAVREGEALVAPIPAGSPYYVDDCGGSMRARFVLTVPKGPMPDAGWPLMVYAHGTTGDAYSVTGTQGFATVAARAGMAAVSTDQPLHGSADPKGARPGSAASFTIRLGPLPIPVPTKGKGAELAFYNIVRPLVLRDNLRQAAADAGWLARLIRATDFSTTSLESQDDVTPPRFAPGPFVAAGHSQGSQSMAALGAIDPEVGGVLLSACGGDFSTAMLARPDSERPLKVVRLVLGLRNDELDPFHPFATLLQTVFDPIDPQTFGRRYRAPSPLSPRSLFMVAGVGDTLTVNVATEALAASLRARPLAPLAEPYPRLKDLSLSPAAAVGRNGAGGAATFALLQVTPSADYDGHFVAFREASARASMQRYLEALARGERAPTVRAVP